MEYYVAGSVFVFVFLVWQMPCHCFFRRFGWKWLLSAILPIVLWPPFLLTALGYGFSKFWERVKETAGDKIPHQEHD